MACAPGTRAAARVYVDDPVAVAFEQYAAYDTHVAGKAYQLHPAAVEQIGYDTLPLVSGGVVARRKDECLHAVTPGARDDAGRGFVAHHECYFGLYASAPARLGDSLEIASAAACKYR